MSSTGQNAPLLIGNLSSISISAIVSIVGSIAKPENFNFEVMKQRILVVDSKIRSRIEQDTDESFLKNAAQFRLQVCYRPYVYTCYSLASSPLPFWICFFTVCLSYLDWDRYHVGRRSSYRNYRITFSRSKKSDIGSNKKNYHFFLILEYLG